MCRTLLSLAVTLSLSIPWAHGQWQALDVLDHGSASHLNANDDYLFAATKGGIFRTNDPSNGWEKITAGDQAMEYRKIAVFDNLIFGMTLLHRSANSGDDGLEMIIWQDDFPYDFRYMAQKGDTLIAERFNGANQVFSSNDEGLTWSAYDFPYPGVRKIVADGEYFYQVSDYAIHRTTDLENFEQLGAELNPGSIWDEALTTDHSLLLHHDGQIVRSDDQGDTWTTADVPSELSNDYFITDWKHHGDTVAASVAGPNGGLLWSIDDGMTWAFFPIGISNPLGVSDHPVSVVFFEDELYIARKFGTVHHVAVIDDVLDLTPVGNGLQVANAAGISRSGDRIYVHRSHRGIYQSDTHLESVEPVSGLPNIDWSYTPVQMVEYGLSGTCIEIDDIENSTYFNTHESTNWQSLQGYPSNTLGNVVSFQAQNDTLFFKWEFELRYTADNGQTWNMLISPGLNPFIAGADNIFLAKAGRVYYNSFTAGLGYTDDLGASFNAVDQNIGETVFGMHTHGDQLFFVSDFYHAISNDNGETWIAYENPSRFTTSYVRENLIVAAGRGNDVYYSTDFGASFNAMPSGNDELPIFSEYDQIIVDDTRVYLSVEDGNVYYADLADLGLPTFTGISESNGNIFRTYPNPATETVWFEPFQEITQLTIYNLQGQQIESLQLTPGTNSMNVDHLPEGLYLLQLRNRVSGETARGQILIQR